MKDNKNLFKKMDAFLEDSTNSLAFFEDDVINTTIV